MPRRYHHIIQYTQLIFLVKLATEINLFASWYEPTSHVFLSVLETESFTLLTSFFFLRLQRQVNMLYEYIVRMLPS